MEPQGHVVEMMNRMVNEYGFPPGVANLLQYFFCNLNESLYGKTRITDAKAKAFVESAHTYNENLCAQRSEKGIFDEDMEALKELERTYAMPTRFYKIRAKESGAFGMRLDYYLANELEKLLSLLSALNPEKEKDPFLAYFRAMTSDMKKTTNELSLEFAKHYSHWFY